jgi:hypothetical protein
MRIFAATLFALFATGLCRTAWAGPEDNVHARFEQWIATFNSHDADRLSQLYDQDARLLSTGGSEKPLDGRETIRVYFIPFMKRGDSVAFDHDDAVKVASNIGIETGYSRYLGVTVYFCVREEGRQLDDRSPPLIQSPKPDSRAGSLGHVR